MSDKLPIPESLEVFGNSMVREAVVLLFVYQAIEDLIDAGLMTGPKRMNDKGRAALAEIERLGYEPSREQLKAAIHFVFGGEGE